MNTKIRFFLLCSFVLSLHSATALAAPTPEVQAATPEAFQIPESKSQVVKLTDKGLEPSILEMNNKDKIVFFVNETTESLATLEIDFGKHATHCASANMKIDKDTGLIRSIRPFGPRDFASTCFHDPGTYPITVYGLRGAPKGLKSQIVISQ